MITATFDKTVKYLAKSENSAANDILRALLQADDWGVRSHAFDALYLKKDNAINTELFVRFLEDEQRWMKTDVVNPDRIARLVDTVIRGGDERLRNAAIDVVLRLRIYDGLKSVLPLLESPREDEARLAANAIFSLAEKFYQELAACTSSTELRNMDRRREWFSTELEGAVRRFSIHGMVESLQAFLMVTKKDYASFLSVMGDHHSDAVKKILDFLEHGDHGSYLRLLLSFVDDPDAIPQIDIIISSRTDVKFVRYLLEVVGPQAGAQTKQALKRFKDFQWLSQDHPDLPMILEGLEPNFVQLITNISLPREKLIEFLRFVFAKCTPEGRKSAADAFRALGGDDFNVVLLEVAEDPDPGVCSMLLRLIKSRNLKEGDQIIMRCVERNEPELLQTIYDLVPDFHLESYLQKVDQFPEPIARTLGRIVKKVDQGTDNILHSELSSTAPVRRIAAINTIRYMGIARKFQDKLCALLENDEETKVRIAVCDTLCTVLSREAIQALKDATRERAFALREAAEIAVQKWMELYNQSTNK